MSEPVDIDDAMRRGRRSVSIDIEIAALADGHQGVVDHAQLIQLGLSSRAISRRVAAGRLHVLHRGVYAVGDRALPRLGRVVAAVYAAARPRLRATAPLPPCTTYARITASRR